MRPLPQVATYWAPAGEGDYAVSTFVAPVLLQCFWEEKSELVRVPTGEEFTTQAIVYLGVPVLRQGFLALGDFHNSADPFLTGASEIRGYSEIPDLRNVDTTRKALL